MAQLLNEGIAMDIGYLDFSKAFEAVTHRQAVKVWAG